MPKFYLQILVLLATFSGAVHAQQQEAEPDIYNQCVEQTIQALQLASINNSVVEICSERAKHLNEKKIVSLLDQIRVQSQQDSQPERYQAILKSQRLWKAYVEQECDNAGQYVGSPMYAFVLCSSMLNGLYSYSNTFTKEFSRITHKNKM